MMGLDIAYGSPLSKSNPPHYAVVIIDDRGRVVYETSDAPLKRVVRLVWEYKVKRIGLDNVFELAPSPRSVAKLLSLLPDDIEIYQVTLDEGSFVHIREQASKIGITLTSKPRPLQTAYVCALLALNRIGTPVRAVEHRTKIIVARARSVGAGGSSANRYARGMRSAILRAVRAIKKALDEASINYDLVFRKGRGGLDSAVFIVYAPRSALQSIVKPFHGSDVRVVIRPEYRSILLLDESPKTRKNFVFVGIDPGVETGLAVIDLSLRPLLIKSAKDLDRASILDLIYSVGIPVLIATDKNPPPDAVKKLASTLGVPLYVPPKSLSVAEKEQLIEWLRRRSKLDIKINTTHERDALAAAIKAYKLYERKFVEIEQRAKELGLDIDLDELKLLLIKGKSVGEVLEQAVENYINEVLYSYGESEQHIVKLCSSRAAVDDRVKALEKRLEELTRERDHLKEQVAELKKRVEELEFELRYKPQMPFDETVYRDRVVSELREKVRQLQGYIESIDAERSELRKVVARFEELLKSLARGDLVVVPRLNMLTLSELQRIDIDAEAVLLEREYIDINAVPVVKNHNIVILLTNCTEEFKNQLLSMGIPIYCGVEVVERLDTVALLTREKLRESIELARKQLQHFMESKKREHRRELSLEDLIKIVEEYRESIRKSQLVEQDHG